MSKAIYSPNNETDRKLLRFSGKDCTLVKKGPKTSLVRFENGVKKTVKTGDLIMID